MADYFYGCVSFSKKRMLAGYEPHRKAFSETDPRSSFMQFDMVFRRLAVLSDLKIRVISLPEVRILDSNKSGSMWGDNIFNVWVTLWTKINENLPAIYDDYKAGVIRSDAVPDFLRSEKGLLRLRELGYLKREKITQEVRERWKLISTVPFETLWNMAE